MNAPFNATSEACRDVMAARDSAFIAPTDVFLEILFSGGQHDRHVKTRNAALFYADQKRRLAYAEAVMRDYVGLPPREVRS